MTVKISQELKPVKPEEAERWLEDYKFPRQRNKKLGQLQKLKKAMEKGAFKQGQQIHLGILSNGEGHQATYLINGQHTLTAIAETGLPQILSVLTSECTTEEEINHLYAVEDKAAPRTSQDGIRAHNLQGQFDLPIGYLSSSLSAIRFITGGFYGSVQFHAQLDDEEVVEFLRKYKQAITEYYRYIAGSSGGVRVGLSRSSSQSVLMTALMGEKHKEAADFIVSIATDVYDEAEPVIQMAIKHMAETYMPTGRPIHRTQIMHPARAARMVAAYWNAWVMNREFVEPTNTESAQPINILYTEFLNPDVSY